MRVLLDLNTLGTGYSAEATRTGIFRATESFVRALLARPGVQLAFSAEATWVSELQLLSYFREHAGTGADRVLRAWKHPNATDEEGSRLISQIVEDEAAGRDARRDRASLTLLNATARRVPLPGSFDLLHSLRTALPAHDRVPARVRVLTVHDLIPLLHPEWMYEGAEAQIRAILASIGAGDFVIANSECTARDIQAQLGIPRHRIFVTPFAAAPAIFHPEEDPSVIAQVRARYGIPPGDYLLSLCTLEPRKNLPHLIRCFLRLLEQEQFPEVSLVLVGPAGWKAEPLFAALAERPELRSRIILPGYVPDHDLAAVYSGARAFVYPSFYEGFGLPVLEAMQCGTPVISSNTSSLPEVAGDAALLVAPTDGDALCEALRVLLVDERRAAELRRRGLARAATFSWERTAALTLTAYQEMLAAS